MSFKSDRLKLGFRFKFADLFPIIHFTILFYVYAVAVLSEFNSVTYLSRKIGTRI